MFMYMHIYIYKGCISPRGGKDTNVDEQTHVYIYLAGRFLAREPPRARTDTIDENCVHACMYRHTHTRKIVHTCGERHTYDAWIRNLMRPL
jgi:hypothetical protein